MHGLRRRLGPERIELDGPGYRLRLAPGELDLERFELLVARGRAELAAGEADAAASSFREALGLWRGPAYEDVRYEAFAQAEVARLEELRLAALEDRIEADLALGRHRELVPELEALVAEHGSRERLCGQLMLALYRSDRQADALEVFRRARRRDARRSSGSSPGPRCRSCSGRSSEQDAALAVEPAELRARRHLPAPATPLVGRDAELAELAALLRGGSRLVTLTGAGGIGKTRLALQTGHDLADGFADGVYFVDLSHLTEPGAGPRRDRGRARAAPAQRDEPPVAALQAFLARRAGPCCCSTTSRSSTPRLRW